MIGAAEIVFGGRRHLSLAAPLIRGAARPWPSPFDGAADEVLQHRGRQICVLASGDPFHYGVGTVLARKIDAREMIVVPAPSAFSLAAARLGWSLPQTALLSVHGRTLDLVRPHLIPEKFLGMVLAIVLFVAIMALILWLIDRPKVPTWLVVVGFLGPVTVAMVVGLFYPALSTTYRSFQVSTKR